MNQYVFAIHLWTFQMKKGMVCGEFRFLRILQQHNKKYHPAIEKFYICKWQEFMLAALLMLIITSEGTLRSYYPCLSQKLAEFEQSPFGCFARVEMPNDKVNKMAPVWSKIRIKKCSAIPSNPDKYTFINLEPLPYICKTTVINAFLTCSACNPSLFCTNTALTIRWITGMDSPNTSATTVFMGSMA